MPFLVILVKTRALPVAGPQSSRALKWHKEAYCRCNQTWGPGVLRLTVASPDKSELRFKIEYRYRGLLFHYILYCFGLLHCICLFLNNGLIGI